LGVEPDMLVRMKKDDLLFGNRELQKKAGKILAEGTPRRFGVEVVNIAGSTLTLELKTLNIGEVDIYVDDRPVGSKEITGGTTELSVEIPPEGGTVRLEGFEDKMLVGARRLNFQ
jgi:hypothetical protein